MFPVSLTSVRVLITRPAEQSQAWAHLFRSAGAEPVLFPTVTIGPPTSWAPLDDCLAHLERYDWLVFSSAAAVRHTLGRLPDRASLQQKRVAAVGDATAHALSTQGVRVDLIPSEGADQNGQGLAQALAPLATGTRVLFPQAIGGRPELRDALVANGCSVHVVAASQTLAVSPLPPVPTFDVATFASPSALLAMVDAAGLSTLANQPMAVLGKTTAAAAQKLGMHPEVATAPRGEDMVLAVSRALGAWRSRHSSP